VAAAVTVTVLVLLVGSATTPLAGILAAVALFAMDAMFEVHVSVLSEPLFLACLALTLAAMVHAPTRPLRSGVPAALGALTRYAGLSLVGAVALWQLLQRAPRAARLRRAVVAVLPALLLQGMWVLRTRRMGGSTAIRRFAVYTGGLRATLAQGGATLAGWLVPDPDAPSEPMSHHDWLALAVGVVLLVLVIAGARRARQLARTTTAAAPSTFAWRLIAASVVLTACYAGMLLASRLLADPAIPLDNRLLAPVLFLATTIVATTIALWWRASRSTLARVVVAGALLGWWSASAADTYDDAEYALEQGSDFAGEQWRRSDLLAWAATRGTTYPLYTNWSAAPYFHLHRPSRLLPLRNDARALVAFPDTLRVRDGRALVFTVAGTEYATAQQLAALRGLRVVARLRDGVVLAAVPERSR
jgi:hypothetical protein